MPAALSQVWLEVVPPAENNQGWVLQEFPRARPGGDSHLVLELRKELSVQGRVVASHMNEDPAVRRLYALSNDLDLGGVTPA